MKVRDKRFLFGADPEVFVYDSSKRRYIGGHGLTTGTKRRPRKVCWDIHVQVDGMALEFNILPAINSEDFVDRIHKGKRLLNQIVKEQGNYKVVARPTVTFRESEWDKAPNEAKILGCDPDFCAYDGVVINEPPNAEVNFRTGAGHIAIGWAEDIPTTNKMFKQICAAMARELDATIGVASLLFDNDKKRRTLYGKAGCFRPKPFGVEYRTLSNKWVKNQRLTTFVYDCALIAVRNMMYIDERPLISTQAPEIREIINENNVKEAIYFLEHYKLMFPHHRDRKD